MKSFFISFILLCFFSQSAFAVAIAEVEPNNTCIEAQALSNITTDANMEIGPSTLTKTTDELDYYKVNISQAGTLTLYVTSAENTDVYMSTICGTNKVLSGTGGVAQLAIPSGGDTVYFLFDSKYNGTHTYGFDLIFKVAAPPVAFEDIAETLEDTPVDIDVTANDTDDGSIDKTTVIITDPVSHGTTAIDATTGIVTYTPDSGYNGNDTFKYRVKDNLGNLSNEIDVLIIITMPIQSVENCNTGTEADYRDFCLRKQVMLPGNMLTIGNTLLVAPGTELTNDDDTSICSSYTNGPYIDNATDPNDQYYLCQYHEGGGLYPATTASVQFPDASNSEIEWAGLYWQALIDDGNIASVTGMAPKIKNNSSSYVNIGGFDKLNYHDSGFPGTTSYAAFKDITTILQTNGWKDGNFTVANIPVKEGKYNFLGTFGAWTLVIIYKNPSEAIRSFSVFDGYKRVSNTSPNNNIAIPVAGFYTPKSGDIHASVSVFVAEGDKNREGDQLKVLKKSNNTLITLPANSNNTFNSSIAGVSSRTPDPTNNNGIDIHTYQLGIDGVDVLSHEQSDITFHFTTSDIDNYWPSMLAFSSEVYSPSFCYDYAYQQNGVFITEENNDTLREPRITGLVTNGDDLDVTLFIRNQEDSDVIAKNLKLNIMDINTTQASYKSGTVSILNPDEVVALPVPDANLIITSDDIRDIGFADVAGEKYIYAYYTLTPNLPASLNGDMNISLNATFTYDLFLPLPSGDITIPSVSTAGGANLPLCSAGNFEFIKKEAWGIFNVVDTDIYAEGEYYNIPTQVVRRVGNFSVVAYDSNTSNVNYTETPDTNSTTLVGIDMIDAGAFHDILATCSEATSGISPILWMNFENSSTLDLKQEIADAIADSRLTISSVDEYFPNAVQSAAFRIHYLTTNTGDEELIKTEDAGGGNVKLLNFTELVQDISVCKQPVRKFPDSDLMTIQVPVACANAGNAGLSPFEVQRCMECLFGYNTTHVCSRDNFSIRPESFNIKINDTNQSDVVKTRLVDGVTGVAVPSGEILNISAGYRYNFEVNATSHVGNEATPGYSRYFDPLFPADFNATLIWEPTNAAVNPFCNDINNTSLAFNMINGKIDALGDHNNVGEYRFNIVDKSWTKVDWDINGDGMKHHRDNPTYYKGGSTGLDCDIASSAILPNATIETDASGATLANLNGCTIDSNDHDNIDANIKYRDHDLILHPYDFNVSDIVFNKGINGLIIPKDQVNYVYMNNVHEDHNMSLRYDGNLTAVGADNTQLSNFVANCYAENVDIDLSHTALPATPAFNMHMREFDANENLINETNATGTAGNTTTTYQLPAVSFTKELNGTARIEYNFNLTRTVNNPVNPIELTYNDFNASCSVSGNCQSNADMRSDHLPAGEIDSNNSITHIFGRLHTPRQRVANPGPTAAITATIPLYYEFYCTTGCNITDYSAAQPLPLSPIGQLSPDDVRWYIQGQHTLAPDGNATATSPRSTADTANITTSLINTVDAFTQTGNYTYNGNRGYPYKTTIELTAPAWLIFNRYDAAATVNDFELEFYTTGRWAGQDESNMNVDANTSVNVNRRIEW